MWQAHFLTVVLYSFTTWGGAVVGETDLPSADQLVAGRGKITNHLALLNLVFRCRMIDRSRFLLGKGASAVAKYLHCQVEE